MEITEQLNENDVTDTAITAVSPKNLNEESKAIIEQIIAEKDEQKVRDLTQLFNTNQNKKTMARVDFRHCDAD